MKSLVKVGMMFAIPLSCMFMTSCGNERGKTFTVDVREDKETKSFFNISLNCTDKAMKENGYFYGDIVTVTAKTADGLNTWTADLPYVTNYNEAGTFGPCLCDYESLGNPLQISPGFKTKGIAENNYYIGGTCEIKMKKADGYYDMRYLARVTTKLSFEECGCENTKYANCRDVINVGLIAEKIKANTLFRGSSPVCEAKNKGRYIAADNYLNYHGMKYDISLSLTDDQLASIIDKGEKVGPYFSTLFNQHKDQIFTINLGNDFCRTKEGTETIDKGGDMVCKMFNYIASKSDGSFFIHCNEGKDRTGFILMIIEALCGVSLNDLIADYMLTFCNYYNITQINNIEKYNAMANLTCYRNLYAFMIDANNGNDRFDKLASIDMLTFNFKKAVDDLMEQYKEDPDYLVKCATKYMKNIKCTDECINAIKTKFKLTSSN